MLSIFGLCAGMFLAGAPPARAQPAGSPDLWRSQDFRLQALPRHSARFQRGFSGWYKMRHFSENTRSDARWHEETLASTIREVAAALFRAAGLPDQFIFVDVLTCRYENASLGLGGYAVICLPLALTFESEDEVAFVLGHEIAHHIRGDVDDPRSLIDQKFSPRSEREADQIAIELAILAGYSPSGAIDYLLRLAGSGPASPSVAHYQAPLDRVKELEAYLSTIASEKIMNRTLSPLGKHWDESARRSVQYLSSVDETARSYVDFMEETLVEKRNEPGRDAFARDQCVGLYRGMDALASQRGFSELLLEILSVSYLNCFFFTGTKDLYNAFVERHVNIDRLSLHGLWIIALSGNGVSRVPRLAVYDALTARISAKPDNLPRQAKEKQAFQIDYVQAHYHQTCYLHGLLTGLWWVMGEEGKRRYLLAATRAMQTRLNELRAPQGLQRVLVSGCEALLNDGIDLFKQKYQMHLNRELQIMRRDPDYARKNALMIATLNLAGVRISGSNAITDLMHQIHD
jgi:hypothetical protein